MSMLCITPTGANNYLHQVVASADLCSNGYVMPYNTDYVDLNNLGVLFQHYFDFDAALFGVIVGANLVTFAIGHGLGRMMMAWRKTF